MNFEPLNFELFLASWRPFLDPLPLYGPWAGAALMVPLVFLISLVYRALKVGELKHLPGQTVKLTAEIVVMMVVAAAVLYGVVEWAV